MKITDKNVLLILGIGLPIFLILIIGIILIAAIIDKLSFREAFEARQYSATIIITYVGAILGFVFSKSSKREENNEEVEETDLKNFLRPIISLILTGGLMLFLFLIAISLVFDIITFDNYKAASAITTWVLTGSTSFIIGRYFGRANNLKLK